MIRRILLVAGTIFTEAKRRREIYVIVLVTVALLLMASTIRFFDLKELHKFYHEISLKVMSMATVLTVIVLAARQLPREFERRTIYTLLARPITRLEFLLGKYLGSVGAGLFCLALFMGVFWVGAAIGKSPAQPLIFFEYIYLQALLVAVIAALAMALSMVTALDAAIVICALIYLLGQVLTNAMVFVYDAVGGAGRAALLALNYLVPQPALFDLSAKVVHQWEPLGPGALAMNTLYALMFIVPYLTLSYLWLRRRAL